MKIRVSLVHYLNSAPLGWAFIHGPFRDEFDVFPASPALCADQLSKGTVDIGLIPSIEYQRIPGLRIVPDVSISSLAEVRSILLVKPRGKKEIKSVALDSSSRTSVALTKILLYKKLNIHPEFVPYPPDLNLMLGKCDAALIIGDPALGVALADYETMDLAGEWVQWQKKPFVCAFWASRPDFSVSEKLISVFLEAKAWGLERRAEIAAVYAKSLNLPARFLEKYLEENINFEMSSSHIQGVETFYQLAREMNLIPALEPLRFAGRFNLSAFSAH
jgi:chorismate dehydratase